MKLLLHSCCGPCTTFPLAFLRSEGFLVTGFFFNPNIYPDEEREKRWDVYRRYSSAVHIPVMKEDVAHKAWIDAVRGNLEKPERCHLCYKMRLFAAARAAKDMGFDAFTTTLLVSPYQDHEGIISIMKAASVEYQIPYVYRDFRVGYRRSREMARGNHLYMQKYCGCEFSLKEMTPSGGESDARPT